MAKSTQAAKDGVGPETAGIPPLFVDRSFWGITATQFLGAFNDNLYKQTLLLMFVGVSLGGAEFDFQGPATIAFAVPFILFSGFAGYLSDRYRKRTVIVASKVAEIVVMVAATIGFVIHAQTGFTTFLLVYLVGVLFLMGSQSAFFGPGKYGVLPELFRKGDLPQANSLILMTTFVAVIFGSWLAGLLKENFEHQLWLVGLVAVGIGAVGTWTSTLLRKTPAVAPDLELEVDSLAIPGDVREVLGRDRQLLRALLATSYYWLAAAFVQLTVNVVGKNQLDLSDSATSLMVGAVSIGIAAGSALGAPLLGHKVRLLPPYIAGWFTIACMVVMAIPGFSLTHWLGYYGLVVVLMLVGASTAFFLIPLQVIIQIRPPQSLKGRIIATQNLMNWIGITAAGAVYFASSWVIDRLGWPPSWNYLCVAAVLVLMMLTVFPKADSADSAVDTDTSKRLRLARRRR
ncbi:MAG: MFS transporter [Planctomycetales bacterium]|nr:MFS transporter [Planctomycetales bacterium]